ncbi:methyl-accepting chemotaxis protein [Thermomonas sp.]|uniref:methyl-accepting chemotaxis protein n=1 Tax=Thermomonas sp. TaxID=1971895 RepID=UPI00260CEB1D|nr:methyl-accepting chemotaxis protein [Thermomonas sp.]
MSRKAIMERSVTQREREYRDGELIISRTNKGGAITYVNEYFCEISGFSEEELIGQPHNIIRHPDMPAAAFADLWATLNKGLPWTGVVKNYAKGGDHYWVVAHVAPMRDERGDVTGYLSVRRKPTREQVLRSERDYASMRAGTLGDVVVRNGQLVKVPLAERMNPLWKLNLTTRLYLFSLVAPALAAWLLLRNGVVSGLDWALVLAVAGGMLYSAYWLSKDVVHRANQVRQSLREMSGGTYTSRIDISRNDEIGRILMGVKVLQTRQAYYVEELRREGEKSRRVVEALNAATDSIMVARSDRTVVYANRALLADFGASEAEIATAVAGFKIENVIGMPLEEFHPQPDVGRKVLAGLTAPYAETIVLGGLTFDVVMTPVFDERGATIGYVAEWKNRTQELVVEREIEQVVAGAVRGELERRIEENGKQGFQLTLARQLNAMLASMGQAIGEIRHVLSALAEGDLTRRVETRLHGAFGEMARNANDTVEQLSETVGQIQDAVDVIRSAASEIAAGNDDLSQRTEQQAAHLEKTATSMEELTSTIQSNAENARNARELAEGAAKIAQQGGVLVDSAVGTMGRITAASHKIEEIIGVIDGIAFQTNILALNAAVEAARAGEQGRGFAVVAGEVRTLAQRSATSAREIKTLIDASVQAVDQGATQVQDTGGTIGALVGEVDKVSGLVVEISAASEEQAAGVRVVNQAVAELDSSTQQNAALVEEASASARSMADQASALAELVAHFKLR